MKKVANALNYFERVYEIIQSIPRGKVLTYGAISSMMNRRISAAAVGWALNGLPNNAKKQYSMETVPWHRVINSKGRLSTKIITNLVDKRGRPIKLQRALLEQEGIVFNDDESINLSHYFFKPVYPKK